MGMKKPSYNLPGQFPAGLKFVNQESLKQMLYFPGDMAKVPTEINKLNNQVLVHYFEDEWAKFL
ncbi:spermidine synthase [compost metagenome]